MPQIIELTEEVSDPVLEKAIGRVLDEYIQQSDSFLERMKKGYEEYQKSQRTIEHKVSRTFWLAKKEVVEGYGREAQGSEGIFQC